MCPFDFKNLDSQILISPFLYTQLDLQASVCLNISAKYHLHKLPAYVSVITGGDTIVVRKNWRLCAMQISRKVTAFCLKKNYLWKLHTALLFFCVWNEIVILSAEVMQSASQAWSAGQRNRKGMPPATRPPPPRSTQVQTLVA